MDTGDAIVTLFSGDYDIGVAALANSLYRVGFRGTIWAGYRGAGAPWARPLVKKDGYTEFSPCEGLNIAFVPVQTDWHFTNYKPFLMTDVWTRLAPDAERLFFFDPDITVQCRWQFFRDWASESIAVCEDANSPMDTSHPVRSWWRRYFLEQGIQLPNAVDNFANAGFIGVPRRHIAFLEEWKRAIQIVGRQPGALASLYMGDRTNPINVPDQDALNIAIMGTAVPVSWIGRDAMDFIAGSIMSHAIGAKKPWHGRFIADVVRGRRVTRAEQRFIQNASGPIRPRSAARLLWWRFEAWMARILGRLVA